jgi:nitrate/nitrite-specific signal transduction histidine kinase
LSARSLNHNPLETGGAQPNRTALEVQVEADGCGFQVNRGGKKARAQGRLGLVGMHERASVLGGTLSIRSRRHRGTQFRARLALSYSGLQMLRTTSSERCDF